MKLVTPTRRITLAVLLPAALCLPELGRSETYGAGVSLTEATSIAELTADPERFAGATVRVEGAVDAVCEMQGCWILLRDEGAQVRVKVPDGEIVFPASAVGQRAAAQGTVEVLALERDEWVAWQKHLAEETGAAFDEATVGDGPYVRLRIAGTGALIPLSP